MVLGKYYYIEYLTLHEFGHTLGLPDFYEERDWYNNWDHRLESVTAIMNIPHKAEGIRPDQDIAHLDALYVRHSPHGIDNP